MDRERRATIKEDLAARGIAWHSLRYHKRPSLPATVFDALAGALRAAWLVRRHGLDAVHARNHVPAATALIVRRLTGCRLIFDLRGLMAEEYVDAGRWKHGGAPYRITRRIQRAAIDHCAAMVMLTGRVRQHLFGTAPPSWAHVIPCCADLELVAAQRGEREAARAELGVGDREVLVYVGKFGGWYMEPEMARFFAVARRERPRLFFLIVTQGERADVIAELERHGIPPSDYEVTRAEPAQLGRYLAAADYGISFIRPSFSKISSSPTKVGEYLAAGLPIVSTSGIGDVDALLGEYAVGVLAKDFSRAGLRAAAQDLEELAADPGTAERCRRAAAERLSLSKVGVPRYDALYRQVAEASGKGTAVTRVQT
jgi:glycosyltransferase involved in cell wall biosynthesis